MADKRNDIGPAGKRVADNVARLRGQKKLTYAELSRRLADAGWPIPVLGLRRIERLERRVDVDDLCALADVLGVPAERLAFESGLSFEIRLVSPAGAVNNNPEE